jgi:hypothetical protein
VEELLAPIEKYNANDVSIIQELYKNLINLFEVMLKPFNPLIQLKVIFV